jgi:AmmeMemoRadiSam system protein B
VFLLGPSHHAYIPGAALPTAVVYETPLGPIDIDTETVAALEATEAFVRATVKVEEKEHSLEMHLPYIRKVFAGLSFKLVPLIIGATEPAQERRLGEVLAPYLEDPTNLFIVSSDFCVRPKQHWGRHFDYMPHDPEKGAVHQYIEWLDRIGMGLIEAHDSDRLRSYLDSTGNTICGKHPILVLLETFRACSLAFRTSFVKYDQSSKAVGKQDSSVSYAAAVSSSIN